MTVRHPEYQYLDLLEDTLYHGIEREDRTGVGSKTTWWKTLNFDLADGFPLFTTRFIGFRIAFEEMMFFIRGDTDTKKLEAKNVNIWKGNTSREFLDKRGLVDLPEGDMGKGYGWQMRNFGGGDGHKGFDQLAYLVNNIRNSPNDRRHLMSYWNPQQVLNEAALPPCHFSYGCQVVEGRLNAGFVMRSSDLWNGLPTNIAGYAFLTHLIASLTNLKVGTLSYLGMDCHLYKNQYEAVIELLKREPKKFGGFRFRKEVRSLEEVGGLGFEDVEVVDYQHCGKMNKIEMAV